MQLSTQYGFAFLCMPKCASTSIEEAISSYCSINFSVHPALKHINAKNFRKYVLSYHNLLIPDKKIETFCLIREPVDWVYSWYRFRTRDDLKNPAHPNHNNYTGNISFAQFINDLVDKKDVPYVNIGSQSQFIKLDNGSIGIDNIFPIERMDLVRNFLSKKIGKEINIPVRNVAPKIDFNVSQSDLYKLKEIYISDIDLYNNICKRY